MTLAARGPRPDRAAVEGWLLERGWRVGPDSATFYDAATGVRFGVDWVPAPATATLLAKVPLPRIDPFGAEVVDELRALCTAFELAPAGGSLDGFLAHWRAENAVATAAAAAAGTTRTLPAARNLAIWQWNRAAEAYYDRLTTVETTPCCPALVRLVAMGADDATALTAVTWVEAAPIALPEVDLVLAVGEGDSVTRAIPMVALLPYLERFPRRDAGHRFGRSGIVYETGLPHWIVDYDLPPEELVDALRTLGTVRRLVPLEFDAVLDRELTDPVRMSRRTPPFAPSRERRPTA